MRKDIINKLKCNVCGDPYRISFIPKVGNDPKDENTLKYAIVTCKCGDFPIVDGILTTRGYKNLNKVIDTIRSSRSDKEIRRTPLLLIEEPFIRMVLMLEWAIKRFIPKWKGFSFWKLTTFIQNSHYGTYLKYRFASPSYISGLAMLPVFKEGLAKGGLLLDLGCGAGHFSFILSQYFGQEKLVCVDKHYFNVFMAKNHIVGSHANYICLDADVQLPFLDKTFSVVLSMDAFHCIEQKQLLADEIKRVLKDDGILFMIHIHNKLVPFMSNCLPLTPDGYASLFPEYLSVSFPERYLVQQVFENKGLELGMAPSKESVDSSDAISIIFTRNRSFIMQYESFFAFDNASRNKYENYIINPLFMKIGSIFVRRPPSNFYEKEYYLIKEFFPEKVPANLSENALKKKLILIPAPINFMKKGERWFRVRLWR